MEFDELPTIGAWRHHTAREAVEVATFAAADDGWVLRGTSTGVEDSAAWTVTYEIAVDHAWRTRTAHVTAVSERGTSALELTADEGRWSVGGRPAPELDGCLDVDLEASVVTNTLTVRRLARSSLTAADVPAAYVRLPDLRVEVLDQTYERVDAARYAYSAPAFDVRCALTYDAAGLIVDYPGLATRLR